MNMEKATFKYPPLPLSNWEESKDTLHLFLQVVGKIRLAHVPKTNHWWHVPLYVSAYGLTTRPMQYDDGIFEIEFNLIEHKLTIKTDQHEEKSIALDRVSVSEFHDHVVGILASMGIDASINPVPYDIPYTEPFTQIYHRTYDREYINRFWRILVSVNSVFERFRAKYTGKSTPVHLFWHHMDLVVTRFSGNRAPDREWPTKVEKEAYSHEVISFGFWAGDNIVREAAFYAYVYPEPESLADQQIQPAAAHWTTAPGYTMAFLPYEEVRNASNPDEEIMNFLDSVYMAGCTCSKWNYRELELS